VLMWCASVKQHATGAAVLSAARRFARKQELLS
jgi:hypothetical protein